MMKETLQEKAERYTSEIADVVRIVLTTDQANQIEKMLIQVLKIQDRDTRHACAFAIKDLANTTFLKFGDGSTALCPDEAHNAVLSCQGGIE